MTLVGANIVVKIHT